MYLPKISGLLKAAGITTYAQLIKTDVSRPQGILSKAGIRQPDSEPQLLA